MKKIITAINNPRINNELKSINKNIKVIGKDIQYKEGILELLEKNKNIDYIILLENLLGKINLFNLLKKKNKINKNIKIILLIKKNNYKKNKSIIKNKNIIKIFYTNKIKSEIILSKILKNDNENIKKEVDIKAKNNKNFIYNFILRKLNMLVECLRKIVFKSKRNRNYISNIENSKNFLIIDSNFNGIIYLIKTIINKNNKKLNFKLNYNCKNSIDKNIIKNIIKKYNLEKIIN